MRLRTLSLLTLLVLLAGCSSSAEVAPEPAPADAAPAQTPTVLQAPDLVQRYQETITADDLAAHLYFYASDYFAGRETTTPGQRLAARYLASNFQKLGLEPRGTIHTDDPRAPERFFQPFTVYGRPLTQAVLTVEREGEAAASAVFSATNQSPLGYLAFGNRPQVEGGVVFAGYGIGDDELGYDDYAALQEAGLDASGKWLLVLRDEPLDTEGIPLLEPANAPTAWSTNFYQKIRAAYGAGDIAGLLVVDDVGPLVEQTVAESAFRAAAGLDRVGNLSLTPPEDDGRGYPPVYRVSSELANTLLEGTDTTIDALQTRINETREPFVMDVPGVTVRSNLVQETASYTTENVIAYLEGSDPELKDEVVVLTSHYDHVGVNPAMIAAGEDGIYNGADDDGTGNVAMLEIAEAFVKAAEDGYRPRRSIVFLAVSGEEKGLLGSEYYADQEPLFPLENTVTNLNVDMIGRQDPTREGDENYVYIIGSKIISEDLDRINQQVNDTTDIGLALDDRFNTRADPNQFYRRSDHWNFGKHGIPFIFYFTGTHEDYHQPGDEPHKILYERHAKVARLIFGTAWQVANQDARPEVSGEGFN